MKQVASFVVLLVILFSVTGCKPLNGNSSISPDQIPGTIAGIDRTVEIVSYDISGKEVVMTGVGRADFDKYYPNAVSLTEDTDSIIVAETIAVHYSHMQGFAVTYYDVLVEESWKGEIGIGDTLTVMQPSGYVRGDIFSEQRGLWGEEPLTADQLVKELVYGEPLPEVGERYILFLTEWNEPELKNIYCTVGEFMGRYVIENGNVSRYKPEDNPDIYNVPGYTADPETLDGLRLAVADTLKI
ncbi:hypothetical protein SAMN02745823_03623 [Sporobacter termitidis DSM 10068]|uniref:Uncharacterized protein n=1 Tax=Sporobacter termitidis DSM 10068 TaxID=1123282 RepID=A0A1M5ZET8_9FIRM|nr:hypothetical protein [Sporobacter termitidis]SHI22672.1 hypothetical protein SAMN02745823_03623 [Sporobacter termitidis DSM 10068]